jgi:hypothetical protein
MFDKLSAGTKVLLLLEEKKNDFSEETNLLVLNLKL